MKGFFYYQHPNSDEIIGVLGEVRKLESLDNYLDDGIIITTFNKEQIYLLLPEKQIGLDYLNSVELRVSSIHYNSKEEYSIAFEQSVEFCKSNRGKIVLSRVIANRIDQNFSLKSYFSKLCAAYPNAFKSCFSIENSSVWIGATPEVLIKGRDGEYEVYSLAGSRDASEPFDWTDKEREEQQFVTDEISNVLRRMEVEFEVSHPSTMRAGNVEHLLSVFKISTNAPIEVMNHLHPTPAVCGLPKDKAYEMIRSIEKHDRRFYAGIIGIKEGGKLDMYVNLRCAEISDQTLSCYVGGGITKDSELQKEWNETIFKSRTLLSLIEKK